MSHKVDTIDARTHEGNLNKLGFWIFLTAEFAPFWYAFRNTVNPPTWWGLRWHDDNRAI